MRNLLWLLLIVGGIASADPARHYLYLFSFDDGQQTPTANHTWATFVKVTGGTSPQVTAQTIDWLARSKKINTLAMGPERSRNFPASEAFEWAVHSHLALSQWGPYPTTALFYDLAIKQKNSLESDGIWYRVLDSQNRIFKVLDPSSVPAPRAVMCVHAVSDLVYSVDPRGFLLTGATSGNEATARVAWHFNQWYLHDAKGAPLGVESTEEAAMARVLNLAAYPSIVRRPLVEKNNLYCRTLSECRETADTLTLPPDPKY